MAVEGYDLMMLGILAAAALLGYFKGIVWQIAWIAGIAASTFVALRFAGHLAPFIGQQPPWNRLIAMLSLYVGTSLVVWLLFRVVSGAIDAVHLSAFDHQLGLLLGIAKGALLCIVITFFAVTLAPAYRPQVVGSQSGKIVAEVITRADEILPREIAEAVNPFVKQFEDTLRNGGHPDESAINGQPSALAAIWEGVTSAAAWTGGGPAGQGGQQAAGQQLGGPTATGFGGPATPAGWNAPAASQTTPGTTPAFAPPRPATSGFTAPAAGFAPVGPRYQSAPQPVAPQPFPVGAQSPLPIR
jgi:membrane protein required for colicin V production